MTIPNPNIAIADGYKTFTSSASSTEITSSLWLCFLILFIAFNLAKLLGPDIFAIANYNKRIYRGSIDQIKRVYTSSVASAQLYAALGRMCKFTLKTDQTVTVETVNVPGVGILAMVRGLPPNLPTSQLNQVLETTLYCHFQPHPHAPLDTPLPAKNRTSTESAAIDTSHRDLWRGTCIQDAVETSSSALPSSTSPPDASHTQVPRAGGTTTKPRRHLTAPLTNNRADPSAQNEAVGNDDGAKELNARPLHQSSSLAPHDPLDVDAYTRD
ncbi:uncharacterized protein EKO05_0011233 [Ascochyta rabiei]|uniref:uncharacterized protein n=1 Tax=Didymella rabiei TaxID=5454 RepID=UPI0019000B8F|nr:uncharacterized protein EKO05_0011233 [Ascochyta rabiei]UPX21027.1 hypothetical protein EKO05_0011233 [Ascochyta rabiei]